MSIPDHQLDPDECWWCERCNKPCMGPTCDECTKAIKNEDADRAIQDKLDAR